MKDAEQEQVDFRISLPRNNNPLHRFFQAVYIFFIIHYLFWWIPFALLSVIIWNSAYFLVVPAAILIYLPFFFNYDHVKLGRPWNGFRQSSLWDFAQRYGGLEVIRTHELTPNKQYIFGFHPHGILILSRVATYGGLFEKLFPGIETRVLGATPMFWIPGGREMCLWMGAIDASKKTAVHCLKAGKSLIIYPGGSKEIFETNPNLNDVTLVLNNRKGFIKLALEHGTPLVPVVVFGERHFYNKMELDPKVKNWFLKCFVSLYCCFGAVGSLGCLYENQWRWFMAPQLPLTK